MPPTRAQDYIASAPQAVPQKEHPDAVSARQTLWEQGGLAVMLALTSGYVDAYAYLNYKIYVSFMSGNTTQTGLQAGQSDLAKAWHALLPILAFVLGVFAATLLLHSGLRAPRRWLLASVAGLLGASLGGAPQWLEIVLLGAAMGALNTTISRVGAQSVGLGYVTGTLNNLAQHLALALKRLPVPQSKGAWDTHGRRAALLGSVWAGFLIGALLGGALTPRLAAWTLVPSMLLLAALAMLDPITGDEA